MSKEDKKPEYKTLFDELFALGKEALKDAKKEVVKRKVKQKFQAALTSAQEQEIDADTVKTEQLSDLQNLNINSILDAINKKEAASATIIALKALYSEMFGEEMKEL